MNLELTRTYYPDGTNGVLRHKNRFQYYTIELPWLNNQPKYSCVPEGVYRLVPRYSNRLEKHFMLQEVRDRELILIHPATNALKELDGCIAPVTKLTGHGTGIASRLAFESLKKLVFGLKDDSPFFLTIKS